VTRKERAAIAKAIADQLRPDIVGLGIESEEQLREAALDASVEMVDLNGDGTPEVIVNGGKNFGCSPTGNCPFWVLRKTHHGYDVLLYADSAQGFTIERNCSDGFNDIVVVMHGSATVSGLTVYRYERGRYHDVACYVAAWSVLEGDAVRELKEPLITPCGTR